MQGAIFSDHLQNCESLEDIEASCKNVNEFGDINTHHTSSHDRIISSIESKLKDLATEEWEIQMKMSLLSQQAQLWSYNLSKKLAHLDKLEQQFSTESSELAHTLEQIAVTSENITSQVRGLSSTQLNLETILNLIGSIQEVYGALEIIQQSLSEEDYEQAVMALKAFQRLVGSEESQFLQDDQHMEELGTRNSPSSRQQLLEILNINDKECLVSINQAKMDLIGIVKNNFQQAITLGNKAQFARFSKLLTPLGLQNEAKSHYFDFLKDILIKQADKDFENLTKQKIGDSRSEYYDFISCSETLSRLFVSADDLLRDHKENIEREFGPSNFIKFCRSLQTEIDIKAIKILDKFVEDKNSTLKLQIDQVHMKIEFNKIVTTLDELSILSKLCQKFDQFLRNCSHNVLRTISPEADIVKDLEGSQYNKHDGLLEITALCKRMQELMGSYVSLEHIYMQKSIQRASEETDEITWNDQDQKCSTMVQDIFFILQNSLSRAIDTCDVYVACAVVNHITSLLSTDVKAYLENKMNSSHSYYLDYVSKLNNLKDFNILDSFPDSIKKSIEKGNIMYGASISWIHTINNIQSCVEFIDSFQQRSEYKFNEQFSQYSHKHEMELDYKETEEEGHRMMFHHTVSNIITVRNELEALHNMGCKMTLNTLKSFILPKLAPLDGIQFDIGEAEYTDYQINDPFLPSFLLSMNILNGYLNQYFNISTVTVCIQILVAKIVKAIESVALRKKFSLLGGMHFDQIVRKLINFFSSISSKPLRSKFSRLIEIGDLLSLSSLQDFPDLWDLSKNWKLSMEDIHQILKCRADFSSDEIREYLQ